MLGDLPAARLVVLILTYNEEENLPDCLESLRGFDVPIVVVDSGSTDGTRAIAESHGATVLSHPFQSHARQWGWALQNLPLSAAWVLGIDADQRLTRELRDELRAMFARGLDGLEDVDGFYVNRRHVFRGRWLKHGALYPKYLLKLFRADHVQFDDRDLVDHHFYVAGRTTRLRGELVEDNAKERDLVFWLGKHLRYAPLHAREELGRRVGDDGWRLTGSLFGSPDQRTVWLKQRWYRLPLFVRPFLYFGYRYVLRGGFLDGKQGFIFHVLQAFWYRLLVDVLLDELLDQRARASSAVDDVGAAHRRSAAVER